MRDRPVDPDWAGQHHDHPAAEDQAISDRSPGRVVCFERPKKCERACADRVPMLALAGHDHLIADLESDVAVRAEVGRRVVFFRIDPTLLGDPYVESRRAHGGIVGSLQLGRTKAAAAIR
jgi:hypothetical protein